MRVCLAIGSMFAAGALVSCGNRDRNKNDNPPPVKTEDPSRAPLNQDVNLNTTGGTTTGGTTTGGTTTGGTTTGGTTTGGTTTGGTTTGGTTTGGTTTGGTTTGGTTTGGTTAGGTTTGCSDFSGFYVEDVAKDYFQCTNCQRIIKISQNKCDNLEVIGTLGLKDNFYDDSWTIPKKDVRFSSMRGIFGPIYSQEGYILTDDFSRIWFGVYRKGVISRDAISVTHFYDTPVFKEIRFESIGNERFALSTRTAIAKGTTNDKYVPGEWSEKEPKVVYRKVEQKDISRYLQVEAEQYSFDAVSDIENLLVFSHYEGYYFLPGSEKQFRDYLLSFREMPRTGTGILRDPGLKCEVLADRFREVVLDYYCYLNYAESLSTGTPLMDVIFSYDAPDKLLNELLDAGHDVNGECQITGEILLHRSRIFRNIQTLERVLSLGANVNHQNKSGNTPLHHLFLVDHPRVNQAYDVLKLFERYGADYNVPNKKGITPAHLMASVFHYRNIFNGDLDSSDEKLSMNFFLETIKSGKINFDLRDNYGRNFVHYLLMEGRCYREPCRYDDLLLEAFDYIFQKNPKLFSQRDLSNRLPFQSINEFHSILDPDSPPNGLKKVPNKIYEALKGYAQR